MVDSLEFGTMRFEGIRRTTDERRAIAEFVTGKKLAQEQKGKETLTGHCTDRGACFDASMDVAIRAKQPVCRSSTSRRRKFWVFKSVADRPAGLLRSRDRAE